MTRARLTVTLLSDAPTWGGAEKYLEILATGLPNHDVAPVVVLATDAPLDAMALRLRTREVPVYRLPRIDTLGRVGAFLRNFGHFAWHRTQIIHANLTDPRACNGALVAARAAGHQNLVATEHLPQSPFDSGPVPARHRLAMALLRRHIIVSEASRAALNARGIEASNQVVVQNGIVDPGSTTQGLRTAARATFWPGHAGPIVGFVGRLVGQKQPELFVDLIASLVGSRKDIRGVIIGDGPLRSGLEQRAAALGVAERVRFAGHRDDAVEMMRGLDLLVFTSRYEGMPLTALEAMAVEVPIVAPAIPGMSEVIEDGVTGRLVPVSGAANPPDLSDPGAFSVPVSGVGHAVSDATAAFSMVILELLAKPETAPLLGLAARHACLTRFSAEAMVRSTIAVYDDVLSAPRRRR